MLISVCDSRALLRFLPFVHVFSTQALFLMFHLHLSLPLGPIGPICFLFWEISDSKKSSQLVWGVLFIVGAAESSTICFMATISARLLIN